MVSSFFRIVFFFLFIPSLIHAASIKGKITDSLTKEPLVGAIVVIKDSHKGAAADIDGYFHITDLTEGDYILIINYMGYTQQTISVSVTEDKTTLANISLVQQPDAVEVVIVGTTKKEKESEESSRESEKNADNVINVVSAQAIQKSPDITVANVAQRVSGVTLDRSTDNQGSYAIIRGMEQRYNNTLINGVKIPSPDPQNRFIPLDIIPSELLQRLEVTKALTPSMEGDAIGGTINAIMKDAPDTTLFVVNASTGYSQLFLNRSFLTFDKSSINFQDPDQVHGHYYSSSQADFNIKNLEFKNTRAPLNNLLGVTFGKRVFKNRLGFLISGTNQNTYSGSNSIYNTTFTTLDNKPQTTNVASRQYSTEVKRLGINVKLDYAINGRHHLRLNTLYLNSGDIQARLISDTLIGGNGRYGPGTGYVSVSERSRFQIQKIYNSTLQGEHNLFNKLFLDWTAAYSTAIGQVPDMAEVNTYYTVKSGGGYVDNAVYLNNITHTWQKNTDRDFSGMVNLEYKPLLFKKLFSFKAGALYRDKLRNNYQNDYNLLNTLNSNNQISTYTGIQNAHVYPYQPVGNPEYNTSNYTATENITAYYLQTKTNVGALQILTGVRMESTVQSNTNKTVDYPGYKQHYFYYNDLLPSLHLTYKLNKNQNIRFSVFKSISRPNYFELVDYTIKGNQVNTAGNPNLKRARAVSFDLRYEFYPNKEDVVMVGVFYKNIVDPIERQLLINRTQPTITLGNFGTAINYGFELVGIKYFGKFGVSANYTFIHSEISSPKLLYIKSPTTQADTVVSVLEKRPMQGQSKHIANVSFIFRNQKSGLNCQLSLVFQGSRINQVANNYGLDFYQSNYTDLSLSIEKRILKKFTLFTKINNILNTPYELSTKAGFFIQKDTYGPSYLLGLRYKL